MIVFGHPFQEEAEFVLFIETVFVFQCRETNNTQFVREQQPVCDLQAVERKFQEGGYTSIVSIFLLINTARTVFLFLCI